LQLYILLRAVQARSIFHQTISALNYAAQKVGETPFNNLIAENNTSCSVHYKHGLCTKILQFLTKIKLGKILTAGQQSVIKCFASVSNWFGPLIIIFVDINQLVFTSGNI